MTLIITADDGTETPVTVVPTAAVRWMAFCNKCGFVKTVDGPVPGGMTHDGCNYFAGVHGSVDVTAADPSLLGAVVEMRAALVEALTFVDYVAAQHPSNVPNQQVAERCRAALSRIREATDV